MAHEGCTYTFTASARYREIGRNYGVSHPAGAAETLRYSLQETYLACSACDGSRQEYKRFSKAAGLRMQAERAEVAGFGYKQANAADKAYRSYQSTLEKSAESGIIKSVEMLKQKSSARDGLSPISDKRFNELTIEARKNGATILKGTPEVEKHLKDVGATASAIGDTLLFRSDPTIGEVLEETHHFMQNISGMNDDKPEPLRTILNEIDAKEYIISNASKFGVPRLEIKLAEEEREYYRKLLSEYERKI